MPVIPAPVLSGNQDFTSVLMKVNMAWESWQSTAPTLTGWHLVNGSEIGLSASQLANGVFTSANAEAIVATATYGGRRTLAIGFRGTNDNEDWRLDFQNINQHYDLFAPLTKAIKTLAAKGEFDQVLMTGHSLGGAMTQMFMAEYAGVTPAYGFTTGAPGYVQATAAADARLINYQVSDDPVIFLGDKRALVGQTLSGPLGSLLAGTLANLLSSSFGFPSSLFLNSIPMLTSNYLDRGTNVLLQVPGHPAAAPADLVTFASNYSSTAHDFSTYLTGLASTNPNPFDLAASSRGTAGNDILFGTTAADVINGGNGGDILYLHSTRAEAVLTFDAGALVTVTTPDGGTDSLTSVERLAFSDKHLAYDLRADQSAGKAVRLLGAAFDGTTLTARPDWVGTAISIFDKGVNLLDACQMAIGVMGNPSNESFVTKVFTNVIGRAPTSGELSHFTGMLEGSGGNLSQAQLLQTAMGTAENDVNIGLTGLLTTGLEFA